MTTLEEINDYCKEKMPEGIAFKMVLDRERGCYLIHVRSKETYSVMDRVEYAYVSKNIHQVELPELPTPEGIYQRYALPMATAIQQSIKEKAKNEKI